VTDRNQALSFGKAASLYESIRPTYPAEAARWALGPSVAPGRGTVVDLGAGTGLLTRVLLPLAGRVIPVEPDSDMRDQLEASVPGVTAIAGAAESIPLDAASVDAVVSGQAYHWFDRERAHSEIGRVVRPGGTFAAVWNLRDDAVAWVADLDRAAGETSVPAAGETTAPDGRDPRRDLALDFGTLFWPVERAEFRHQVPMIAGALHSLIASRSNYIVADTKARAEIDDRVEAVVSKLPASFAMPYVTVCYRGIRR
jgi:SAM-dependent methyltransferase